MAIKDRFTGNPGRLIVLTTSGSTDGKGGRNGVGSAGVSGCPAAGFTAALEGTAHLRGKLCTSSQSKTIRIVVPVVMGNRPDSP
uniref:Retrotransposon protein, putative, Ty3-gypsy subclass n=1 Tax=Oryza sativa subsp. japonica TaxID=39947 RepID=Q2QQE6_ORYSJ|nr:retrotransposon protein, putative, Ty3-gypsy subclass [Oryza sativa Japonica Group]